MLDVCITQQSFRVYNSYHSYMNKEGVRGRGGDTDPDHSNILVGSCFIFISFVCNIFRLDLTFVIFSLLQQEKLKETIGSYSKDELFYVNEGLLFRLTALETFGKLDQIACLPKR